VEMDEFRHGRFVSLSSNYSDLGGSSLLCKCVENKA
jgi:hypothetical protein